MTARQTPKKAQRPQSGQLQRSPSTTQTATDYTAPAPHKRTRSYIAPANMRPGMRPSTDPQMGADRQLGSIKCELPPTSALDGAIDQLFVELNNLSVHLYELRDHLGPLLNATTAEGSGDESTSAMPTRLVARLGMAIGIVRDQQNSVREILSLSDLAVQIGPEAP